MRKKTEIPLAVLEALKPFFELNDERIVLADPKKSLIRFEDADKNSGFYFNISSYATSGGSFNLTIAQMPSSRQNPEAIGLNINIKDLDKTFSMWKTLVMAYDEYTLYEDPILKHNEEKFFQQFDIIDEDANKVSFDLEQQIYLDEFLDRANKVLIEFKEGKAPEEITILEDLQNDVINIKNSLTTETKKKIIKKLSVFLAKAQKFGLPLIKEIIKELVIESFKKLLLGS